ncbi:protein kinase domain-containing protein [Prauserella muralis]|uniref:non-specific serine/threonine protein kinase n=1 Tax=Prauserella muralis TaxID=588067 RepID=A0A2V4AKK4_9PSEU|nr:protein kinase [Prauserella muralis]PXY20807.1 serine/threonine protein kinase [Prauserella muralis]TWE29835.1 serine/threonine protein kinase [Prauserella muralis]
MTDEGELIAGRYRLLSPVGQGGMGVVWRARDERLDRTVAVKRLRLDPGAGEQATEEARQRAMREARVAARLRHPQAISVHDVVEHDGTPCLVLEFLPSRSLSAVLAERGPLPVAEVAAIGAQVASALAAAHAEGIVHRDVKPGNVLLTDDGTAKIADFGISRAVGEATVTGDGVLAGTPAYVSPEVAEGGEAGPASDVFSLGATLYAATEGTPPCGEAEHPVALLRRIAAGELVPPRRSGALTGVLAGMLRPARSERPTMEQARDALEAVAAGRPAELPPPPRDPTLLLPGGAGGPPRRPGRRAVLLGGVATVLVAAGVLLGVLITPGRTTGQTASPPSGSSSEPGPQRSTGAVAPSSSAGAPDLACSARYRVTNAWPGGYQAEVTVRNDGDDTLTGWAVSWELPGGHTVDNVWNGEVSRDGSTVTVTSADWNVTVPAGGATTFGFTGSLTGDPEEPAPTCTPT